MIDRLLNYFNKLDFQIQVFWIAIFSTVLTYLGLGLMMLIVWMLNNA